MKKIMKTKVFLFCILFSLLGISVSCSEKNVMESATKFETHVIKPYNYSFFGFGYNQYQCDFTPDFQEEWNWTEERFAMMKERIEVIRPGFVRMPVERIWYNPTFKCGEYDWDCPQMKAHYKFMDLYKEMGVKVLDGWWHVLEYWTDGKGYADLDNVTAFVDYIEHMLNLGYDNIAYFQPSNEPYGTYYDYDVDGGVKRTQYDDWSKFMKEAYKQCEERGLPTDKLCGPDSWDDWIGRAAERNQELASYNFHLYFDGTSRSNDNLSLYDQIMAQVNQVTKWDNSNKPIVCAECGAIKESWSDWPVFKPDDGVAIYTWDYMYPVYMADFAIQAMRAGISTCLSWGLHGFTFGKDGASMWNNSELYGGTKLRPMFYCWGLLCRLFPDGSLPLDMLQRSGNIKVGGCAIGVAGDYTFLISSKAKYDEEVTIELPKGNKGKFYVYSYTRESHGDGEQLSLPYTEVNTKDEITVKVPSESVIFITTLTPIE